jgi:sec-independent protein translocase protein TatB
MFGVGWTEMLVVGVVALIVIGPKDLPVVMHRLGKMLATIRRLGNEFQREINKSTGLDQITDLRRSITEPLKQTAAEITREFNRMTPTGTVEPSGIIAPADPKAESVVSEINAKIAMVPETTPDTPSLDAAPAAPIIAPVPAADAPAPAAKRVRKPRAPKAAAAEAGEASVTAKPKKPAGPRKPRTPKATETET